MTTTSSTPTSTLEYLTIPQVAQRLAISRWLVADLIRDGELTAIRFSPKAIRVRSDHIDEFIESHTTTTRQPAGQAADAAELETTESSAEA